jgi:methyltransferase-like protein
VYSWVSEPIQQRILELCKEALASNGVALISYNVLPGWRQRGLIRDIMMFGASLEPSSDPEKKLQSAAHLIGLVAAARRDKDDLYGRYLNEAISRLQSSDSSYLFHEFLEEHNSPCLFTDFMKKAQSVGLQFLSEARPAFMAGDDLGPEQGRFLDSLATDVIKREQALDIFRNRMLRETVLCHEGHALKRDLRASVFRNLVYSTEYRRGPDISGEIACFRDLVSEREIVMPTGDSTDVLDLVGRIGPSGCNLSELTRSASELSINCRSESEIFSHIVALWRAGFIELSGSHYPALSKAKGLAKTSNLARLQAESDESATSLRHRHYKLSSSERLILAASDGTEDFDGVMARVESVAKGTAVKAVERLLNLGFFQS